MTKQKPDASFVDELIDRNLDEFKWLRSVLFGQFEPEKEVSEIVGEMLLNFVPGVVIVSSARDAVAITMRMANHPEKRDDIMEWMFLCACVIVIALPLAAAGGGAVFAGVGAAVGGVVGSELAAYLKAIILLLMSKSKLSDVLLYFRRIAKGEVITLLMRIRFVECEQLLIAFLVETNTKLMNICAGLKLVLKPYDCFDDVRVVIARLAEWEAKFYAVQTAAVKNIPLALAELDRRLSAILAQARPKEVHTVATGLRAVAPAQLPVVVQRVYAMPGQALRPPAASHATTSVTPIPVPMASKNAKIKNRAEPVGKVVEGPNNKRQATGEVGKISGTNRALPGDMGHAGARSVSPGGTGSALAGHGGKYVDSPSFIVPEGTSITLPKPNLYILDRTGQYIERGDWEGLAELAKTDLRIARDLDGMTTWLPGAEVPGYTLFPPDGAINLFARSHSVIKATPLQQILTPNAGHIEWAACTKFLPCKAWY